MSEPHARRCGAWRYHHQYARYHSFLLSGHIHFFFGCRGQRVGQVARKNRSPNFGIVVAQSRLQWIYMDRNGVQRRLISRQRPTHEMQRPLLTQSSRHRIRLLWFITRMSIVQPRHVRELRERNSPDACCKRLIFGPSIGATCISEADPIVRQKNRRMARKERTRRSLNYMWSLVLPVDRLYLSITRGTRLLRRLGLRVGRLPF